jgi:hypothetical protein
MVLKLWRLGQIRNTWRVLKCGAEEGWRSVRPIMWEMKKYYLELSNKGITYLKQVNGRLTGFVTFWVELHYVIGYWRKDKRGIEVTRRRERRRRKLLDDLKANRVYSYLKEEALDRTMWRAGFGRGFGAIVRQTAEWMNWIRISEKWDIVTGNICWRSFRLKCEFVLTVTDVSDKLVAFIIQGIGEG